MSGSADLGLGLRIESSQPRIGHIFPRLGFEPGPPDSKSCTLPRRYKSWLIHRRGRVQDLESGGQGSMLGWGKCDLDVFSFTITFGGQYGGGSLAA